MASTNQVSRGRVKVGKASFTYVAKFTATVDPVSLADGVGATVNVTAATGSMVGAALGDSVEFGAGVDLAGITVTAYVSAADTVTIRLQNESTGTLDLASSTWKFAVKRFF